MKVLLLLVAFALVSTDSFAIDPRKVPAAPPPLAADSRLFRRARGGYVGVSTLAFDVAEVPPAAIYRPKTCYHQYLQALETKPLLTKSVTAGIVSALGNILSQKVASIVTGQVFQLDMIKMGSFFLTGLAFVGPYYHFWFSALSKIADMLAKKGDSNRKQIATQVAIDQTVGVALFFPAYFYVYEVLESIVAIRAPLLSVAHSQCNANIASVVAANYCVWPWFQILNMGLVPAPLRVLATNLMSVLWNCYFCAHIT